MNSLIIEDDCLRVLDALPSGSVQLVLCDLPYGTTRNACVCCSINSEIKIL